jgi:hypothetical protein
MTAYQHDPQADLDYGWDWSDWLGADTIASSTWTVSPTGPVLSASTSDDTTTTVWVDGGTAGVKYTLTNHVVTTDGREDDRSHTLYVRER